MSGKVAFGKEKEPEGKAGPVEGISIKTGSTDEKPTVSGGDKKEPEGKAGPVEGISIKTGSTDEKPTVSGGDKKYHFTDGSK